MRVEVYGQNFQTDSDSDAQNAEIFRPETICTFSLVFFCILQIYKGSETDGLTDKPF